MKIKLIVTLFLSLCFVSFTSLSKGKKYSSINSGTAWLDQNNKEVNAHGACIVKEGELYYLFGEYKSDTTNAFVGFGCYSSPDLINWKFENVVLSIQNDGILGPNRVGERVKVMKSPSTGEFVMYMHCDDMKYNDPHVGYATCKTINGDYQFHGDLLHDGKYLRKWDLGTFKDADGKGYLLTHEGFIYELADDYQSVNKIVVSDVAKGGESPAMFKRNGYYFWLFSNKTSWERNDNYYFSSKSLEGPWLRKGNFAPEGSLTWNSQCSFVFPIISDSDTLNMYMGDRWSFPKQGSAATHVWQPISVDGDQMSIPEFYENWNFDKKGQYLSVDLALKSVNNITRNTQNNLLESNRKGASITVPFKGVQVAIKGVSNNTSGYAKVILRDNHNKIIVNTIVDFYSKNKESSQKFLSPELKKGNYTIHIEVLGEHPAWSDKRFANYGSTDNYIIIEDVLFR